MGETEYIIFIILTTLIWLVFTGFIVIFIFQYHKRKLVHEREKAILNEQHIQDLLNTKQEIQKQTLADIGREIHDNIGQRLTLASIYANHIAFEDQYPKINQQISAISGILNESLAELRSLSKSLTSANAEFSDLKDLLDSECKRVNALNICVISCTLANTNFKISATIKTFILRIIQEFIQNSLKHANCTHIDMALNYGEQGLQIHVSDDGEGFDFNKYTGTENKGIGLMNMKKRAELIGAEFAINSILNKGTTLKIFIPVNKLNAS